MTTSKDAMIPKYDQVSITLRGIDGSSTKLRMRTLAALEEHGVSEGDINQFHQAAMNAPDFDSLASLVSLTVNVR